MSTHINTGSSITEMESKSRAIDSRPDTDNFQSQETNSTASEYRISRDVAHSVRVIYSTRLALFIHGLHQPREHVKFGQRYFAENVALSL